MKALNSSRISGFHSLTKEERLQKVVEFCDLSTDSQRQLQCASNIPDELADRLIENVITTISIPIGVATNMKVDGEDVLVPMATEESSVVAAVCSAARQCYDSGGFQTSTSGSLMIAQIQLTQISRPHLASLKIIIKAKEIKEKSTINTTSIFDQ